MVIEITRKKAIAVVALIFILVAVGVTVFLSQQNQDTRSRASEESPDTTVVASVNGEDITKAQVREVALEQFASGSVNQEVLKDAMDVLIERMILDDEATSRGISLDSSLVEQRMSAFDLEQNEAYYDLLREQVILKNVKSRKAQSIGFWAPVTADQANLEPEDKIAAESQIKAGVNAIPEMERAMKNSTDIGVLSKTISTKYPVLAASLTINGYRASEIEDSEVSGISGYKIYEFGDSNLDPVVLTGIFAMNVDEIKSFSSTSTNAGGYVFKLLEKGNDSGLGTYDLWYSEKLSSEVIMKGAL